MEETALVQAVQGQAQTCQQVHGAEPPPETGIGNDLLIEIGDEAGADDNAADARG